MLVTKKAWREDARWSLVRTLPKCAHLVVPPDALGAEAGHAALGHDERGARLRPAGHLQVHRAVHGRHLQQAPPACITYSGPFPIVAPMCAVVARTTCFLPKRVPPAIATLKMLHSRTMGVLCAGTHSKATMQGYCNTGSRGANPGDPRQPSWPKTTP